MIPVLKRELEAARISRINTCTPELFQRGQRLMHDIQTQVLDAVDGVDSGVTAIEPSYNQLKAASMSSWN